MSSEGAIRRRVTITFLDGTEVSYTNEEHTFCFDTQAAFINNKYTTEVIYIYPYQTIKKVHQETVR